MEISVAVHTLPNMFITLFFISLRWPMINARHSYLIYKLVESMQPPQMMAATVFFFQNAIASVFFCGLEFVFELFQITQENFATTLKSQRKAEQVTQRINISFTCNFTLPSRHFCVSEISKTLKVADVGNFNVIHVLKLSSLFLLNTMYLWFSITTLFNYVLLNIK